MRVAKWGNSLAVRLPKSLVDELGLKSGDRLDVLSARSDRIVVAKDKTKERAVDRMRERALAIPHDYSFNRDEANTR